MFLSEERRNEVRADVVALARRQHPHFWQHDSDAQVFSKVMNIVNNVIITEVQLVDPSASSAPPQRWADIDDASDVDWD